MKETYVLYQEGRNDTRKRSNLTSGLSRKGAPEILGGEGRGGRIFYGSKLNSGLSPSPNYS